tara:strand:+ start:759 stop:926 length:168 start_codon:yes stop_codon:yes gene_type:complete
MKEDKKPVKTTKKKAEPKSKKLYKITKPNGNTIERYDLGSYVKTYEAKGFKVEEV